MKVIVAILLTLAIASNIRHHKKTSDTQQIALTNQNYNSVDGTQLLEIQDVDVDVEETLNSQTFEEPRPLYINDGSSPEMGLQTQDIVDSSEAPMMSEDAYDLSAAEQTIDGISLIQISEIDALANIDTSMPLFDEEFKVDEQALQETPLNINVNEQSQQSIEESNETQNQDIDTLEMETNEMVEALSNEVEQQDQLINEVQLIQVGGFYY